MLGLREMFGITGLCHLHPALLKLTLTTTQWCPACAPSKQSPLSYSRTVSTPCGLYQRLSGTPYTAWSIVCAEWTLITSTLVLSLPAPQTASPSSPPLPLHTLRLQSLKILSTVCQIAQLQTPPTRTQSPLQTIHKDIQPMFTFTIS